MEINISRIILENDPECLLEIKRLYDANHKNVNRSGMPKGICYGIKRTLDSLGITIKGIND